MPAYKQHLESVGRREPTAVVFDRILHGAGVRVLRSEVPSWRLRPGDTYAVNTLQRIREAYGDAVLGAALRVIVAAGLPVTKDVAQAMARIVRCFPNWAAEPDRLADALSKVPLEKLRREASFLDEPGGIAMLLTEALARQLGPGRRG